MLGKNNLMKEKVTLSGVGVEDQSFDIDHAQNILDLQKMNPPTSWRLNDPKYILIKGIITKVETPTPKSPNI